LHLLNDQIFHSDPDNATLLRPTPVLHFSKRSDTLAFVAGTNTKIHACGRHLRFGGPFPVLALRLLLAFQPL